MQIATRQPGDRRELRHQPLSRVKESVMFSVRLSTILRGVLVVLLCSTAALASDLKITVQSASGERVAGVQVSLFRITDNAGVAVQTTAGDGAATFPHLADGQYRLVVLAPGFAT